MNLVPKISLILHLHFTKIWFILFLHYQHELYPNVLIWCSGDKSCEIHVYIRDWDPQWVASDFAARLRAWLSRGTKSSTNCLISLGLFSSAPKFCEKQNGRNWRNWSRNRHFAGFGHRFRHLSVPVHWIWEDINTQKNVLGWVKCSMTWISGKMRWIIIIINYFRFSPEAIDINSKIWKFALS